MAVAEKVKAIIVDQLGVDADQVAPEASFTDDLGADSLDIVELVMAFEEEFGLEIPDEDAEKIVKVEDACKYIEEHAEDGGDSNRCGHCQPCRRGRPAAAGQRDDGIRPGVRKLGHDPVRHFDFERCGNLAIQ